MEKLILAVRLLARRLGRSFRGFLERNHLDAVRPVPAVLFCLLLGLGVPFLMHVETLPTALDRTVAVDLLRNFVASRAEAQLDASPAGDIVTLRPAFLWRPVEGAVRYRFRILDGDLLALGTDLVTAPALLPHTEGLLVVGRVYRFEASAVGADRRPLGTIGATFRIGEASADVAELREKCRRRLGVADTHLIMAGYFAETGRVHDLVSELAYALEQGLDGEAARVARRVLADVGFEHPL